MAREVLDGLYWIYEGAHDRTEMVRKPDGTLPEWCREGETVHICQSAYLLVGDDDTLLFDTLSPAAGDHLLAELREVLGDRPLDYLVVSHPDVPHAGNTSAIRREYPDCELVAPRYGNDHTLYRLDDALLVGEGDSLDLGGPVVDFHEATFLDAPVSLWMTERSTNALFPVDWLGFPHRSDEALRCVDEIDGDVSHERLFMFHARVLFWHQYVDVEKVQREIDRLVAEYDPDAILPAHGLVIREDATRYMELVKDVVADIERSERVGILG